MNSKSLLISRMDGCLPVAGCPASSSADYRLRLLVAATGEKIVNILLIIAAAVATKWTDITALMQTSEKH